MNGVISSYVQHELGSGTQSEEYSAERSAQPVEYEEDAGILKIVQTSKHNFPEGCITAVGLRVVTVLPDESCFNALRSPSCQQRR